ncbi:putative leucine-rich repeat-containing, plant-type, leucine-rich repeat domain, L [Medicago truncatula]|uniref:Putative leucine-rich repeat-containing, plant-type, leucine-rich repeat domain, L n=1 Tax=Medicago truncatula TaxID=3880 RepID=A0A072UHN3_MEDTR|nr:receptor-like protein 7 [Medicago truncatula]KEH28916.1 verticillium wilt resistance-like protein [Medicago truncatula]RHN58900.1 putative leucine-rich repeat-containing, plant-type, leucine-rich repeat domain, L [Medicago truncatula]
MRITLVSFLSFILFYCIYINIHISFVSGICLDDQQSLLLQLKNNLKFNSKSSHKLKFWNSSIDCCDWNGVACDNRGFVIGLDLSEESITGGFDNTSSLFSLQNLQKLNLAANNFSSAIPPGFNKLVMLSYLNLSYANFVGQIPLEISQLTRLVTLDISSLSYLIGQGLKLENPNLQSLVQNLTSIRQLYLDGVIISAKGHEWSNALLPLHGLEELTMSNCNLTGPLESSLSRLENLSIIILDGNNFSSPVPETFSNFRNLTTLSLESCGLTGKFPQKIFQRGTLSFIDLTFNTNLHGSFPEFPSSGDLQTLRVSMTSFSGAFPYTIGNMRHLSELDLSNSNFNGILPNSLSNLIELRYIDLSFNSFTGPIPSFGMAKNLAHLDLSHNRLSGAIPSSSHFEGLHSLVSINLRDNSINGSIPSSLFALTLLQEIQLSSNRFSKFDEFINVSSSVINTLDLSSNNLSGSFPTSIFQLRSLSVLDLSFNRLNGLLQLDELLKLRNLTALDLSYNNISINVNVENADHTSFSNISTLMLASCNLKTFPSFLRNKSRLNILDLSNNQIHGTVPNWIWKLQNLQNLNVSHNMLTDFEGPLQNITSKLIALDLHNNQLKGPIPVFPEFASYLDYSMNKFDSVIPQDISNYLAFTTFLSLSNNTLQGSIPHSLCNASNLQVLDISINRISGAIPSCLMKMTQTLVVLNLKMNNLIGTIPDVFPPSCVLRTLDLQKNNLHGQIPKSLVKCSALEVLDLAQNNIIDIFPCLLKNISTIRVIVLRKNKFYGRIGCPKTHGTWPRLQIVDLAFNNFSGKLPGKCFTTWEAMRSDENQADCKVKHVQFEVLQFGQIYYHDSVTVTSKGQQMEYVKILTVFTAVDLSSNHFEGEIPKQLFDFKALYVLNLSNNALSGQIPSSIGNLKQLESLDLSNNSLDGEIPTQISTLSFLSFLNLSFNQLSGKIPTGTQLQSFPETSFIGNEKLYGPPLPTNNSNNKIRPTTESVMKFDWQYVSTGIGFGVGAGVVFAPMMFWERGKKWSNGIIDKILMAILPLFGLVYTPVDDDEEDDTKEDPNMTDDSEYNEEEDYWSYPRLYCVFCSKFDNNKKKVIHDPNCTCFHSSPGSNSTDYSDSYSY